MLLLLSIATGVFGNPTTEIKLDACSMALEINTLPVNNADIRCDL